MSRVNALNSELNSVYEFLIDTAQIANSCCVGGQLGEDRNRSSTLVAAAARGFYHLSPS